MQEAEILDLVTYYISKRKTYLSGIPDKKLSERCFHLLNNFSKIDEQGMIIPSSDDINTRARLYDVYAEIILRRGCVDSLIKEYPFQGLTNAMVSSSEECVEKAKKLRSYIKNNNGMLFRFNSFDYMEELVRDGGIFLRSASSYKHEENLSVKDDELSLKFLHYLSDYDRQNYCDMPYMEYQISCPDFLTLCFTDSINYRMISDWNAEAAVIIHDPQEFYIRLDNHTQKLQTEKFKLERGNVRYIDPYFDSSSRIKGEDLPFCKDFRFGYQKEYRFIIRNDKQLDSNQRKVFLGPLVDIATLVDLRNV